MPFTCSSYAQFNVQCLSSPENFTAKYQSSTPPHNKVVLPKTLEQQQQHASVEFLLHATLQQYLCDTSPRGGYSLPFYIWGPCQGICGDHQILSHSFDKSPRYRVSKFSDAKYCQRFLTTTVVKVRLISQ